MSQLFSLFKKDAVAERRSPSQPAPGNSISFDPKLINNLQADHRRLLEVFNQIQAAIAQRDFPAINRKLNEFRTGLQTHLLTENVRLYAYLSHNLASDMANAEIINDFRHEMYGIGHAVMSFLRKYSDVQFNDVMLRDFKRELDEIGAVLVKRIQHEEATLYPLYMPRY